MNTLRSGGHAQGMRTVCPLALVIPSQSPVPLGLIPDASPNSGTRASLTARRIGAEYTEAIAAVAAIKDVVNFMVEKVKETVEVE